MEGDAPGNGSAGLAAVPAVDPLADLVAAQATPRSATFIAPQGGEDVEHLIILLHGYGADARQMVPVGRAVLERVSSAGLLFMNAPETLNQHHVPGLQWFELRLGDARHCARQAAAAAPQFAERVRALMAEYAALSKVQRVDFVGYSQGALMAFAAASLTQAASLPERRIISINGALADPAEQLARWPVDVAVSFVHGSQDIVIPPSSMERSAATLRAAGAKVCATLVPEAGHGLRAGVINAAVRQLVV